MTVEKQTNLILQFFPFLEKEDINALLDISSYKEYKNKETIIQEGVYSPFTFFIIKGAIRGYFIDREGNEKNMFIKTTPNFIGPPDSLFENVSTKYFFEAIQKTCVFKFNFKELEKLTKQSNNIAQVYISALKENVQTLVFRVEMLAAMTPEERYEALISRNPTLFQKAFNKHIANYLGMTPNSLSRIMKRRKTSD